MFNLTEKQIDYIDQDIFVAKFKTNHHQTFQGLQSVDLDRCRLYLHLKRQTNINTYYF